MYVTDENEVGNSELCVAVNDTEVFHDEREENHDSDGDGYLDPYAFSVGSIDFTNSTAAQGVGGRQGYRVRQRARRRR